MTTYENFLNYTEVDPNNRVTVASSRVTVASLTLAESAYVYKDKGVAHFSEDFEHKIDTVMTACGANPSEWNVWGLYNTLGDEETCGAAGNGLTVIWFGTSTLRRIYLRERYGGVSNQVFYNGALNTTYYLTIKRARKVFTCKIYSDSGRTTLLATLSLTLSEVTALRYVFSCQSDTSAGGSPVSGYCENLDLQEHRVFTLKGRGGDARSGINFNKTLKSHKSY